MRHFLIFIYFDDCHLIYKQPHTIYLFCCNLIYSFCILLLVLHAICIQFCVRWAKITGISKQINGKYLRVSGFSADDLANSHQQILLIFTSCRADFFFLLLLANFTWKTVCRHWRTHNHTLVRTHTHGEHHCCTSPPTDNQLCRVTNRRSVAKNSN